MQLHVQNKGTLKFQSLIEIIQEQLPDPRRTSHGNIRHKLEDILIIGLCTVLCGGDSYEAMALTGRVREEYFREFLELPTGIPSADTFERVFRMLDPKGVSKCLVDWLEQERAQGDVIAIDGKTIRGSADECRKALHVVSAFVADSQITLGELPVPEKSNEITAIPELLELIDVSGAVVTADAMACQKKIVEKICKKKGDYVIGLKDNQGEFCSDVALFFSEFENQMPLASTTEKGHGRVEYREYRLCTDIRWLGRSDKWKGLNSVGMVRSQIYHCKNGAGAENVRYYISSLTDVHAFAHAVRKHWSIENQLHWSLDVVFKEDACTIRKDNGPLNMNVLRKVAMSLLNKARIGRQTKKLTMLKASLDPCVMLEVLFQGKK